MNKICSSRTQSPGEDSSKTAFCSLFPRLLEHLQYQRPSRKPMVYSNMVTEMNLIKLFIYKGKGKARGNQQELVQYFEFTTHRSELRAEVCLWREEREENLTSLSSHPLIPGYCLPLESIMQGSPLLQSLRIGLPGHRAGGGGQRENLQGHLLLQIIRHDPGKDMTFPVSTHEIPSYEPELLFPGMSH